MVGNIYTSEIDRRVHIATELDDTVPILTVPQFLDETVCSYGDNIALSWRQEGTKEWIHLTYAEYQMEVRTCAKAFLNLGLERYHAVCILGNNSPEWFISDLAAIHAGGIAVGIYFTNLPDGCYHCCRTSKANIVVVGDEIQLEKILQIQDRLPDLKAIIQVHEPVEENQPNLYSWTEIMELGKSLCDEHLNELIETLVPNECCTLVFTSGTVDNPKAVMLSHDNLIYDATIAARYLDIKGEGNHIIVSFLPLSHVAAQVVDIYASIHLKAHCYFADKNALKGSLIDTLVEVRPTQFLTVPRVWEKIYEKMKEVGSSRSFFKKKIAIWAKAQGLAHNKNKINERPSCSLGYTLANAIVFKRIKKALGFSRCENFISAAAPLSVTIKTYFLSLDIRILELYGMSEASGAHATNSNTAFRINGVGRTIPKARTKIECQDEDGIGEICLKGRNIFMGYLNDLEKTEDAIDEDGWLHSGDLGYIDEDGFIYITGRLKEILITAGGENIPPVLIENNIKAELPHISNAVLVGDQQKYLAVLLTLKTNTDDDGRPLDTLAPKTINWLRSLKCQSTTVTDLIEHPHPQVLAAIQAGIDQANQRALSRVQQVKKFAILPADFSIATGELGPTLKIKRHVVYKKFANIIGNMYEN